MVDPIFTLPLIIFLFNVVKPDTFNDETAVIALFKVVDDETFKIPEHVALPVPSMVNVFKLFELL